MRTYNCQKCKKELSEEMQFCPFCGNKNFEFITIRKFANPNPPTIFEKKPKIEKKKLFKVLLIVFICIAIVSGHVLGFLFSFSEPYSYLDLEYRTSYNANDVIVTIASLTDVKDLKIEIFFYSAYNSSTSRIVKEKGIFKESELLVFTYKTSELYGSSASSNIQHIDIKIIGGKIRKIDFLNSPYST